MKLSRDMRMNNRRGIVLLYTFIVMLMISIVAAAFLFLASGRARAVAGEAASAKAFWLAEAGIQRVVYRLMTEPGYRSAPGNIGNTGLGDGTYSVAVIKSGNAYTITSTGAVYGVQRQVKTVLKDTVFNYAGFGGSSVTMSGNARTDSYNSAVGRYNVNGNIGYKGAVGGNSNITVSGSPFVNGNASTGPSGTFSDPTHTYIYGTVSHSNNVSLPAVAVPSALTGLASGGAITLGKNDSDRVLNSGNYKFSTINISSVRKLTINATTAPVNIYLTGNTTSISITNSGQIAIPATNTYPVTVYTDGSTSVGGAGVVNDTFIPSKLLLYGTGTRAITISNSGSFYGAVYAPSASVSLTGAGVLYGSIIAGSLTLANSGTVHYDQALTGVAPPTASGSFREQDWREI